MPFHGKSDTKTKGKVQLFLDCTYHFSKIRRNRSNIRRFNSLHGVDEWIIQTDLTENTTTYIDFFF